MKREGPFWDVMEGRAPAPPSAALLGWELVAVDPEAGTISVAFTATEQFLNPIGVIQGGLLAAMLDDTLGPALVATLGPGQFGPTLDLHVQFLRPAYPGRLTGHGRVVRRGKDIAFLAGELVDEGGQIVAVATATAQIRLHSVRDRPYPARCQSPQVGAGPVGAMAGGNRVLAGAVVRCGSQGGAAGPRPGRQLLTGAPLLHRGGHPASQDDKCRDHEGESQGIQHTDPVMIGAGRGTVVPLSDDAGGRNGSACIFPRLRRVFGGCGDVSAAGWCPPDQDAGFVTRRRYRPYSARCPRTLR